MIGADHFVAGFGRHDDLDLDLGDEIDFVLGPAVGFLLTLLPAESANFRDRHSVIAEG